MTEIISHMRFPNDPRKRELLSAKSLKPSAGEFLTLARADQLLTALDRLERMEKHYLEGSKLGASVPAVFDHQGQVAWHRVVRLSHFDIGKHTFLFYRADISTTV